MSADSAARAEAIARDQYGRLLALLASRTRDIAAAEDALAEAFAKALQTWPKRGVPDNPAAWLLTTARNRLTDTHRRALKEAPLDAAPPPQANPPTDMTDADATQPDDRLKLMFVCAHPALDARVHTPLMLQCVLGLEAAEIAPAFLLAPATLAQRLVRAKRKIKNAGVAFAIPEMQDWPERVPPVLEAIYAAHALDWLAPRDALGEEALYMADLLVRLLPDHAEAMGLFALICMSHARRDARVRAGRFVPLPEQDTSLWDAQLATLGLTTLQRAAKLGTPGRFQLEAAIQSVHHQRAETGETNWKALLHLHGALLRTAPSLGAHVSYGVCLAETKGPDDGLAYLDKLLPEAQSFQPWWASRASILRSKNALSAAADAYDTALSLTHDPLLQAYLTQQRSACGH
ncbi:RNA polymerase sigma factor [Primorskyibacter sp. S187A]|uniref:RNA polymerase sigma factor n=1 Tax=Primorskyibacter sp. S187A TaxID=3415130 RepID=UPI003C79AFD7